MLPILLLTGCSQDTPYTEKRFVFGTLVEIKTLGVDHGLARAAAAEAFRDLEEMNRTLHAWKPGALGRTNQLLPTGEWFTVATSVLPLLEESKRLHDLSDGLFNPAIGALIDLWGFHGDDLPGALPAADAVAKLVAQHPSMADVQIDGLRARGTNAALRIDLGAIAKGHGVDVAMQRLKGHGIHNALVDAGGDLRVAGRHGDRPWRIGIRDPGGDGILAGVEMGEDEVIFTSGDYERYFEIDGQRYHHIIDPRDGYPARGTRSVTVIHSSGSVADAAATALFVAGPDRWQQIARRMDIDEVLLVDSDGRLYATRPMAARLRFPGDNPPDINVVDLHDNG